MHQIGISTGNEELKAFNDIRVLHDTYASTKYIFFEFIPEDRFWEETDSEGEEYVQIEENYLWIQR